MGDGRGGQHFGVVEEGVGETTHVPQLGEDLAAVGMHGAGHFLPAGYLLVLQSPGVLG